ncbi:MAG: HTTM domain-containing protein [Gemmatimonadota bacterium]|nr:HTTM domain-containing protein [Gemmatimonadota bacterium]
MASTQRSRTAICKAVLTKLVDAAPIGLFRILFGLLMVVEVLRYWAYGRIARYYIEPTFFFSFVEGLKPVGSAMYLVFVLMGASALLLAIGFYYRAASALFFVLYTYTFLLDKAQYNNHYYLICLLAFLFAMTDANRAFSIDAVRRSLPASVPAWQIYVFRLQICIVFFYAGVAKINSDWLAGEPVRAWLAARSDYFLIGPLLLQEWFVYAYAYGGLLFDLFIGFALLWAPTRGIGFVLLVGFNVLNKWFYDIGIFPYLTMATFVIFVNASTIRRWFDRWPRTRAVGRAVVLDLLGPRDSDSSKTTTYTGSSGRRLVRVRSHAMAFLMAMFVLVQIVAPLRHFAIRGHVGWTDEGHNFSWRMKLRDKSVREIAFYN